MYANVFNECEYVRLETVQATPIWDSVTWGFMMNLHVVNDVKRIFVI